MIFLVNLKYYPALVIKQAKFFSPYSYSEMNTAMHLLTSVASVNEVYLFFLLECFFYIPFFSLFVYAVFVSLTALFLFDHG